MLADSGVLFCVAIVLLTTLALVAWVHTRLWGRRPRALTPPLAFACWLGVEVVTVRLLSFFSALHRPTVLLVHTAYVIVGVGLAPRACLDELSALGRGLRRLARGWLPLLITAPLVTLVLLSAVRYAPNNWDAMFYRLARVAHWMERGSVALYPTNNFLQNLYAAGAEYWLLLPQIVSGSDRLVWLLQFLACVVVVLAASPLARLGGARRSVARWAWLFPLTLSTLVLQATSAQIDLVAAVLSIAIVVATLPFLSSRRVGLREGLLLGACLGTASVTKMTAVIPVLPFLALAAVRGPWRRLAGRAGPWVAALVVAAAFYGLELERVRGLSAQREHVATYAFRGWGEWPQRASNVARGTLRNFPVPAALARAVRLAGCPETGWCSFALAPSEDCAGAPLHVLFVVVLTVAGLASRSALARRTRLFTWLLLGAWVGFHCVFKENPWFTRLQLPLFGLVPLLFGGIRVRRRLAVGALIATVALAWVAAISVAIRNQRRPPLAQHVDYVASYYKGDEWIGSLHDQVLAAAARTHCQHMSLRIGPKIVIEYPLVWRAMRSGIEVRHLVDGADSWPCLLFTDPGLPPPPGWKPVQEGGLVGQSVWVRSPGPSFAPSPADTARSR